MSAPVIAKLPNGPEERPAVAGRGPLREKEQGALDPTIRVNEGATRQVDQRRHCNRLRQVIAQLAEGHSLGVQDTRRNHEDRAAARGKQVNHLADEGNNLVEPWLGSFPRAFAILSRREDVEPRERRVADD